MRLAERKKVLCLIATGMALAGLFFCRPILAVNQTINVEAAVVNICGNNVVEGAEQCDGGGTNGGCPATCSATCTLNNCGGGQPPGGGDSAPSISNVVAAPGKTTAKITWQASDDIGIRTFAFEYGLTNAYGISVIPAAAGNYEVNLDGLTVDTVYFYKISVTDTNNQTTVYVNNFNTLKEGELPPSDDNVPPVISDVIVTPGLNTASIVWDTDEPADAQVNYGRTADYGSSASDANLGVWHRVLLLNLQPNVTYHFRVVSTDAAGNSSASVDMTFTTGRDNVPPPDVSNLELRENPNSIVLTWVNPAFAAVPDFAGVKITRKVGVRSENPNDGAEIYRGRGQTYTDNDVAPDIEYFYTVYSIDTSENYSGGIFKSGRVGGGGVPGAEICNNGVDDDGDGQADCNDLDCAGAEVCRQPPRELCNNGLDDDGNGFIDCADPACAAAPACARGPGGEPLAEICDNGIDDDGDGLLNCADPDCAGFAACAVVIGQGPIFVPPVVNVPDFARLRISDLILLAGGRQITMTPQNGRLYSLAGTGVTVVVPKKKLAAKANGIILNVDERDNHSFVYEEASDNYYADIVLPVIGEHQAVVEIDYGAGQVDAIVIPITSLPWGDVLDENNNRLDGVEITLFSANKERFRAEEYGQPNPIITNANGIYGWVALNGQYYIVAKKEGYFDRYVPSVVVKNNIINLRIGMVRQPPQLVDVIKPDAGVVENVQAAAKNVAQQARAAAGRAGQGAGDAIRITRNIAANPTVKKTASNIVAPAVVGVTAVGVAAFNWLNLLGLLRFLFLQPLLLLGRRKREKWGQVYNALNKLPIDLAVVRLIDFRTGKVIQSRVTDKNGRYIFIAKPGEYILSARKALMIFPSLLLKEIKTDGRHVDVYHGEKIVVTEQNAAITANIPLDPLGAEEKPKRVGWGKFSRRLQIALSWAGLVITVISLYINPLWYVWVLLVVHIALFFIFRRLAMPVVAKGWGIVYDLITQKPIKRAVARLFDTQFNKLVDTQVTDKAGKYNFLAGDGRYFVSYEHEKYEPYKTDIIDLQGKEQASIAMDVGLREKSPASEPPPNGAKLEKNEQ